MKLRLLNLVIAIVCILTYGAFLCSGLTEVKGSGADDELTVCSFNIRTSDASDGHYKWRNRRDSLTRFLAERQPDVIGLQEVMYGQLKYLCRRLPDYGFAGVGRDDGRKRGEFAPVFYNRKRYEMLDNGTFWLSDSPEKAGSVGWDASCCRIATWVKLMDKRTERTFLMVNFHLDHLGAVSRRESVRLIADRVNVLAGGDPVVMTCDMNDVEGSEAYVTVTEKSADFLDSHRCAKERIGERFTWHDFGRLPEQWRSKIDFVFVKGMKSVVTSEIPRLNPAHNKKCPYMSDHNPVIVRMCFADDDKVTE